MTAVLTAKYSDIPLDMKEVYRYSGCREGEESIDALVKECLAEVKNLTYKVVYGIFPVEDTGDGVKIGDIATKSLDLKKNLKGCKTACIFVATVGIEMDRLISRYGIISPSKAIIMQGIGAERIESLCDRFCAELGEKRKIKPRFSPGYGDLPLEKQRDIFRILDCARKIGVTLNDSMLMSPSKSVTAIVGIEVE